MKVWILALVVLGTIYLVYRGLQNRRKYKPLMAAAVERLRNEQLVTVADETVPLPELQEIRAESFQVRYIRKDGSDIVVRHDVLGSIEIAVLKAMGADVVTIFTPQFGKGHIIWRPQGDTEHPLSRQ